MVSAAHSTKPTPGHLEIRLSLDSLDDLFVSFDPSRLVARDIDKAIEEFIVEEVSDGPRGCQVRLVVMLPEEAARSADAGELTAAFENYFSFMRDRETARIKRLWREGRQALAVGMIFLAACLSLSQAVRSLTPGGLGAILGEGLVIAGWVANWRPIEIFLYDWRPLRRRRDVYEELSRMSVVVNSKGAT